MHTTDMDVLDALEALGLDGLAFEPAELRRAWRRYAMRHHPDRCPGDPEAAERFDRGRRAHDLLDELLRTNPATAPARFRPWRHGGRSWVA